MTLDPHTALLAGLTLSVGWVMTQAGLSKSALELRRKRRICPSCGHDARGCTCN
jgi:hypothetical protein